MGREMVWGGRKSDGASSDPNATSGRCTTMIDHQHWDLRVDSFLHIPHTAEEIQEMSDIIEAHSLDLFKALHKVNKQVSVSSVGGVMSTKTQQRLAKHDANLVPEPDRMDEAEAWEYLHQVQAEEDDDHECVWCPHNNDGTPM
jgi:acyl-CoA synthetase (NDP forming)